MSNASTLLSSLNIVGNIIGSGTALTNLNYNAILNPPSTVSFNNPSTFISTLNISGRTTLNKAATCLSSLNVSGITTLSGNVGIGTNNPDSKLHIMTPDNTAITTNLLNFKNASDYGIYATSTSISTRGNTLDFYSRDYNLSGGASISTKPIFSLRPEGNVGIGTNDPKALLHVTGKTLIHNGLLATPTNGTYGNDGTRLILWPGAVDNTPYSFGISGGTLWYTVPTGAIHAFFVGTTERLRIDSGGS